jgi:hypothetical protein
MYDVGPLYRRTDRAWDKLAFTAPSRVRWREIRVRLNVSCNVYFMGSGSEDEDMSTGSIGKTAGGKRTVPRIRLNRCPIGSQILGAEAGDKLANRFPVDLVTG